MTTDDDLPVHRPHCIVCGRPFPSALETRDLALLRRRMEFLRDTAIPRAERDGNKSITYYRAEQAALERMLALLEPSP